MLYEYLRRIVTEYEGRDPNSQQTATVVSILQPTARRIWSNLWALRTSFLDSDICNKRDYGLEAALRDLTDETFIHPG